MLFRSVDELPSSVQISSLTPSLSGDLCREYYSSCKYSYTIDGPEDTLLNGSHYSGDSFHVCSIDNWGVSFESVQYVSSRNQSIFSYRITNAGGNDQIRRKYFAQSRKRRSGNIDLSNQLLLRQCLSQIQDHYHQHW